MILQFHSWAYIQTNYNLKRYIHPTVHGSSVYNSQDMEATQVSINGWIKEMLYIYTMEYYSAIKRME